MPHKPHCIESVSGLRAAGLLDRFSEQDGQRLIDYAMKYHLSLTPEVQECYLTDEGGPTIAITAPAFFRICAQTQLWRPGRVSFQVLDDPVGLIATASCFSRDAVGDPWREVSDHARYRDFIQRNLESDPKTPALDEKSLWAICPTRLLQEAAEVQAAFKALGELIAEHRPDHWEPVCLAHVRFQLSKKSSA
jgi:hypothetical protein